MTIGLLFWILMLLWLFWGVWSTWPNWQGPLPGNLLLWVIIALIGWRVFGPMIHG